MGILAGAERPGPGLLSRAGVGLGVRLELALGDFGQQGEGTLGLPVFLCSFVTEKMLILGPRRQGLREECIQSCTVSSG